MIKLIIAGEEPEIESTVRFQFRRHKQSYGCGHLAYLTAEVVQGPGSIHPTLYPVKVDGRAKTVDIRRADFEGLGFTVRIV